MVVPQKAKVLTLLCCDVTLFGSRTTKFKCDHLRGASGSVPMSLGKKKI